MITIRVAVGTTIALWISTGAILSATLLYDTDTVAFRLLVALELWVCAVAVGATIASGVLVSNKLLQAGAKQRRDIFEYGYLAGAADERELRVVSIASHRVPGMRVNGHERNSNKVS
jgi:hypothetical protein